MVNYSYFVTHDKPKHRKINRRVRRLNNEYDPKNRGRTGYRDSYGL